MAHLNTEIPTSMRRRLEGMCPKPNVEHVRITRWDQRALDFCITSFDASPPNLGDQRIVYGVYKQELAPTTRRPHWQCFVQFQAKTHPETALSLLGVRENSYIGAKHGKTEEARGYCLKEDPILDSKPVEKGTPVRLHANRGSRSDLKRLQDAVEKTEDPRDLPASDPSVERLCKRYRGTIRQMYTKKAESTPRKPISDYTLRSWQQKAYDLMSKPATDEIIWFHDTKNSEGRVGKSGKSKLSDILMLTLGFRRILPFMERRDINHRITAKCPGVVMLEDESSFSWDNVNSAKRGVHTSPKYESVDYVREEAFHVLVLSQRPPSVPKHLNVALRVFKIPQVEPRVAIMEVSDEEEDSAPVTAAVDHATRRVTGDDSATDIDE